MADTTKSSIPIHSKFLMAILKGFTMPPINGDDTYEQMSIGVALNSVVATDGHSAILVGENAGTHDATQRKEVVIEATRAQQYGDIVHIDEIPKNVSAAGEVLPMPNIEQIIRKGLSDMKPLASINPKALASICSVATAAGAISVDLFQPEGEPDRLGFQFSVTPEERHTSLFTEWEGPIKVRGVFMVVKGQFESITAEPEHSEIAVDVVPQAGERKTGRRPKDQAILSPDLVEQITAPVREWADFTEERKIGTWTLPALNLLQPIEDSEADSGAYEKEIASVLRAFNLAGRVVASHKGPSITQYEIEVPMGTNVSRYIKLQDDLQVQLGVKSLVVSLIPGKKTLAIEIPNLVPRTVRLLEIVGLKNFAENPHPLTFALGTGIGGTAVYADLTATPHLLIGGATNSGKSIGMATLLTSLILRNSPKELRLVMIDPKKVEFTLFDGLPHLMCPVITDLKEAAGVLRALWREMDRRYDLLKDAKVRNIGTYNEVHADKLPYIVVAIDELADLMMQCGAEVETVIVRLAQQARAVGIHLVIATQRPSVDVVTGLIKANVPSRIAFNVASGIDSKVILDSVGAEKLLGRGDMLFSPIESSGKATRIQGAFVSEAEIKAVCEHWRKQASPLYDIVLDSEVEKPIAGVGIDDGVTFSDDLLDECARWVIERGQASTSLIQRKFSVGFQRASRLLDALEARGVIGPRDGPRPREVLISLAAWEAGHE